MAPGANAVGDDHPFPIETPRLVLRRLQPGDLDRFAACRADPELARYQGWTPLSRAQATAFIGEMATAPAWREEAWLQIAIAEPQGALLGDIGLCLHAGGELELGFTLGRAAQGRGLATEALQALIGAVQSHPAVRRVVAIADARNIACLRLLQRLGMVHVSSEATVFKGEPCTELRYQLDLQAGPIHR